MVDGFLLFILQSLQPDSLRSVNEELRVVVRRSDIGYALFPFFYQVLQEKVVTGTDVVVLVSLNALPSVIFIDTVLSLHAVQNLGVDWHRVYADLDALEIGFTGYQVEPWVLSDLIYCVSFLRVSVQNAVKEVLCFIRDVIWGLKVST